MQPVFQIYEDFDPTPDQTREYMLSCRYDQIGNYPGFRAVPSQEWVDHQKILLENVIEDEVVLWQDYFTYPLLFHWSHDGHISWIHHDYSALSGDLRKDNIEVWAGIHYMTPDAPIEAGTALYRRKDDHADGLFHPNRKGGPDADIDMYDSGSENMDEWEMSAWCGNVYNRLVTYRAHLYHRNLCGFGTNKRNGRLTQLFFYGRKLS